MFPVFCLMPIALTSVVLGGCTSDPYAPINQSTPLRQLDNALIHPEAATTNAQRRHPYQPGRYNSPSYSRY